MLFLAIVSGIDLSLLILVEKKVLEITKLTLNAIGIIAQKRTMNLKRMIVKLT